MISLKIISMYLLKYNGVYTTTYSKGMTSLAFPQRWHFPDSCHCKANDLYFCLYKLILHRSVFEKLKRFSLLRLPTFCLFAYSWLLVALGVKSEAWYNSGTHSTTWSFVSPSALGRHQSEHSLNSKMEAQVTVVIHRTCSSNTITY